MDRNVVLDGDQEIGVVALRKESVDRNTILLGGFYDSEGSLSARRAWIEISKYAL